MSALVQPILIEQGATFALSVQVGNGATAYDLTGHSARMQVRREDKPAAPPILDLSTTDAGEIVFSTSGVVTCTASAAQTAAIAYVPRRRYRYDLILRTPTDQVYRLLGGKAVVSPGISSLGSPPAAGMLLSSAPVTDMGVVTLSEPYAWLR